MLLTYRIIFLTCYLIKTHLKFLCCYICAAQLAYVTNLLNYCDVPWSAIAVKNRWLIGANRDDATLPFNTSHAYKVRMHCYGNQGKKALKEVAILVFRPTAWPFSKPDPVCVHRHDLVHKRLDRWKNVFRNIKNSSVIHVQRQEWIDENILLWNWVVQIEEKRTLAAEDNAVVMKMKSLEHVLKS